MTPPIRAVLTEQVANPTRHRCMTLSNHSLVLFDRGDEISVQAGAEGIRFLLVSGKPIEEPVAWYGPIVMNTPGRVQQAMTELRTARSSNTPEARPLTHLAPAAVSSLAWTPGSSRS